MDLLCDHKHTEAVVYVTVFLEGVNKNSGDNNHRQIFVSGPRSLLVDPIMSAYNMTFWN